MAGDLPTISLEAFRAADLRVARVVSVRPHPKARSPAYVVELDLGPLGRRTSSAQISELYAPDDLVGRLVVVAANLPPKEVAGTTSQVRILGADGPGGVVVLRPGREVAPGARIR